MKIQIDKYNCCLSKTCQFTRDCAQHTTAGDFRTESGDRPKITRDLNCLSYNNLESNGFGFIDDLQNNFYEPEIESKTLKDAFLKVYRNENPYLMLSVYIADTGQSVISDDFWFEDLNGNVSDEKEAQVLLINSAAHGRVYKFNMLEETKWENNTSIFVNQDQIEIWKAVNPFE